MAVAPRTISPLESKSYRRKFASSNWLTFLRSTVAGVNVNGFRGPAFNFLADYSEYLHISIDALRIYSHLNSGAL